MAMPDSPPKFQCQHQHAGERDQTPKTRPLSLSQATESREADQVLGKRNSTEESRYQGHPLLPIQAQGPVSGCCSEGLMVVASHYY